MADYSEISLAQATYKAGIGQDFMRQVRDNFINHEGRLVKAQQGIRVFDHFIRRSSGVQAPSWPTIEQTASGGGSSGTGFDNDWLFSSDLGGADATRNPAPPAFSVRRMQCGSAASNLSNVRSLMGLRFDAITAPMIVEMRLKLSADFDLRAGMLQWDPATAFFTDQAGLWIERVDSTNWRAVSYSTSRNNGSSWAKPTAGNWFVLRVEWTSGQAVFKVDGVTKDTLTTQLPTTTILHLASGCRGTGSVGGNYDSDRYEFACDGIADAA